jgi:phosphotransferase system  glucose/maltose/N-acetylglucosamine-specific IIC component
MAVPKRPALVIGLIGLGAAISFVLGLFSGVPEDVSEAWYAFLSLVFVVAVTALAVHIALGRRREGEDIETLFAIVGVLLGALFAAVFTEAFAVGTSVAAHQGWGDPETNFFFIPSEQRWRPRLLDFRENALAVGALIGVIPGFAGWGSRKTALWSEPPTKFPPN